MNEQLKLLIELQEIDSAILSMAEHIELLPVKLDRFRVPLKESKEAFQKFQKKSEELNKKKKDRDIALEEVEDKINKLKARSSDVKTNKEYEAHLKEIAVFEKKKGQIEDEILVFMEEIDNYSAELENEEARVKKAEADFQEQERIMEEEIKKARTRLDASKAKRKGYATKIDEDIYRQYMKLLKRFNGTAVVETINEVCMGCNRNIPPQFYSNVIKSEGFHNCCYCKRFLYYKEPSTADDKPGEIPPVS